MAHLNMIPGYESLSARARKAMYQTGITTLEHLRMDANDGFQRLSMARNCGQATIRKCQQFLRQASGEVVDNPSEVDPNDVDDPNWVWPCLRTETRSDESPAPGGHLPNGNEQFATE